MRREKLVEGEIYHICNKSIANFGIFNDIKNGYRFLYTLDYYNNQLVKTSFSDYINIKGSYEYDNVLFPRENSYLKFLGFCIMPDHYHLLVKILISDFSKYISKVENSYSKFFNAKFKRKGPLWQSRYRSVWIKSNEQLLHVHRYIHLNPTSSGLTKYPEEWILSSYKDFIKNPEFLNEKIKEISISNPVKYKKFVEEQRDYQKRLKQIKNLILE